MTSSPAAPFRPVSFLERDIEVERRPDGVHIVRNRVPLAPTPAHIPALFRERSAAHPDRVWLAQRRGPARAWQPLHYGQAQRQIDAVTQALLNLAQPGRNVMILSGNSLEHAVLLLAAMQARMPVAPVTPAYSLLSSDHQKLKAMAALLQPAVVFVQSGQRFEAALRSLDLSQATVVAVDDLSTAVPMVAWHDWLTTPVTAQVAASAAEITPDTVAKYLFTSGSTNMPKAVTTTQRMMSHAVVMTAQLIQRAPDDPGAVVLDWMPWSHVAAGSTVFNGIIEEGGTLYIDEGKPVPGAFDETVRNLREVSPHRISNVPVGFAMLVDALEQDEALAANFFKRLETMAYAGARLPDEVYTRLQRLAVRHTGYRIPFVSGFGATETGPSATYVFWLAERVGLMGLPHPGVEVKLLPLGDGRYETRVRSAAVTPGYLGQSEVTRQAFDEEGFFKMGDAATYVDEQDPREGLVFAGRIAEEFKLISGTFVRVGSVRVACVDALAPLASDLVVTGADQPFVGLLVWPNLAQGRLLLGRPDATLADLAEAPAVRAHVEAALNRYNAAQPGSSTRIGRALLLDTPPSLDAGEITDKGYINQRQALARRDAAVQRLYAPAPDAQVICL